MNQKQLTERVLRILTDRKHLDDEVDKMIHSENCNQFEAYDRVCDFVYSIFPKVKMPYKNGASYWITRNRKRNQKIQNKVTRAKGGKG